ncbi:hypothetical protein TUM17387_23680 [Shewanella carassii]|nr:hypothetical protein TUM17387_23680 [Shewanella carassii]
MDSINPESARLKAGHPSRGAGLKPWHILAKDRLEGAKRLDGKMRHLSQRYWEGVYRENSFTWVYWGFVGRYS